MSAQRLRIVIWANDFEHPTNKGETYNTYAFSENNKKKAIADTKSITNILSSRKKKNGGITLTTEVYRTEEEAWETDQTLFKYSFKLNKYLEPK